MGLDAMARRVLLAGLWWPTLHTNDQEWVVRCDTCQRVKKLLNKCKYIVVAMEYLIKWGKAQALPNNTTVNTARFIYEQIVTRYDIPIQITSDRGEHFMNHVIRLMMTEFHIFHNLSSPYYPMSKRTSKVYKQSTSLSFTSPMA